VKSYRRIEITAFRRRVTVVSGEFGLGPSGGRPSPAVGADDRVSLGDLDSGESIGVESPEGQILIAEAVRLLERCLYAEARATTSSSCAAPGPPEGLRPPTRQTEFHLKLRSLARAVTWRRFLRKER
jgi:hypothetical protein